MLEQPQIAIVKTAPELATATGGGETFRIELEDGEAYPLVTVLRAESIATAAGWTYTRQAGASDYDLVPSPGSVSGSTADVDITCGYQAEKLRANDVVLLFDLGLGPGPGGETRYMAVPVESWAEFQGYTGFSGADPKALVSTPGSGADGVPLWDRGTC